MLDKAKYHPNYDILDEATSPIQEVIHGLQHFTKGIKDDQAQLKMDIDTVKIETPIELDIHVNEDGKVVLGSSSRHTTADISFEPVLHQLRLSITEIPEDGS